MTFDLVWLFHRLLWAGCKVYEDFNVDCFTFRIGVPW